MATESAQVPKPTIVHPVKEGGRLDGHSLETICCKAPPILYRSGFAACSKCGGYMRSEYSAKNYKKYASQSALDIESGKTISGGSGKDKSVLVAAREFGKKKGLKPLPNQLTLKDVGAEGVTHDG